MNAKPQLFQLQKFYEKRHLWDKCYPRFVHRYKETEEKMAALGDASFAKKALPRLDLMNWFLNDIQHIDGVDDVLAKIPDEEYIPVNGRKFTKQSFKETFYGVSPKEKDPEPKPPAKVSTTGRPLMRMIANAHAMGGGEMSSSNIMRMMRQRGYDVVFHPSRSISGNYHVPEGVVKDEAMNSEPDGECDILVFYANDFVYKIKDHREKWERLLKKARRKILVLNFVMGQASLDWFAKYFDKVMFLNHTKEKDYLNKIKIPPMKTKALAPPVFIEKYLDVQPDYSKITFIRHGRYNGKYDEKDTEFLVEKFLQTTPNSHFWFMASPPFLNKKYGKDERFHLFRWNGMDIKDFLKEGSLFHYHLPKRMEDQGPRVIVEAMACGIPIIADKRDGAKERVTNETGWLCESKEDYVRIVQEIVKDPKILEVKGRAARKRAIEIFQPQRWADEIIGYD